MAKTRLDVIHQALRHLGVLASDTDASADDAAYTGGALDTLFAEIQNTQGITVTWALDATPDTAFLPLSRLLAVEVADHFEVPPKESFARAMGRLRAALIPDDRDDRRDLDDDGTITEAEIAADKRAQFY
jgi:hypothetical protein